MCDSDIRNIEVLSVKIIFKNTSVERMPHHKALDCFTYTFDSEISSSFAILGANGAGKSTLLESILGLCRISEGSIEFDDVCVKSENYKIIRERCGFVFQNSDDQLFCPTVEEDISFGLANLKLSQNEIRERCLTALKMLGIEKLSDRSVNCLSGGEKKRAALAGVLAMNPETILFDEPTSMLDPGSSRQLAETMSGLDAFKIIATHDLVFARRCCTHGIILSEGRLAAHGKLEDIMKNHDLLSVCGLE